MNRFGRFQGFLLISAVLVGAAIVSAGLLVASFFERHVLTRDEAQTAEMVRSQVRQHLLLRDFSAGTTQGEKFQVFLEGLPGVFRIKIYEPGGRIIWSNEPKLMGMQFPDNPSFLAALHGQVTTVLERPRGSEHVYERARGYVAEAYIPISVPPDPRIIAVIETYTDMSAAMSDLHRTQRVIWTVVGILGLALWGALAVVVWQASASERWAIGRLEQKNRELVLIHEFTRSVLRPVELGQVAANVVESAGAGLHLAHAALYRVEAGERLDLVTEWPAGSVVLPPSRDLVSEALARGAPVLRGVAMAILLSAQNGPAHLFVGMLRRGVAEPGAATLRVLEIMLHEAAIVLANVELFTRVREAHEQLAAILAGVADEMVIIDRGRRIVWMNTAAAAVVGGDAIGRVCFELAGASSTEGCEGSPAVRTLLTGMLERGVRARVGADGRTTYLDLIAAPLRDTSGRVHQVLEVARDITDLVEMEERLKQANHALLDAQAKLVEKERLAAVGQVVVSLHHAILNPLAGILGALQVLRQTLPGAAEQNRAIAEAEDQARKIERLIKRLPDLQSVTGTPYVGGTTMLDLDRSCGKEDLPPTDGPSAR